MKPILWVAAVAALAFSGCRLFDRNVTVSDVTKAETFVLKKEAGQDGIVGLKISGEGQITGKAEIQLILNGSVYRKEEVAGASSFEWRGDWYSDQAEVRYVPMAVTAGALKISYRFY